MSTEGRRNHIPVRTVAGRTGDITLAAADVAGAEATANKGAANGYASLGADGKVPAGQLPAAGGGGLPARIPLTEYYQTWTASTAGANLGHQSCGVPLTESGTYRIKACLRVGAQSNNPTQVELRSPTTQPLVAIDSVAKTARTLYAANTQIALWNKGSALAADDIFTFESADISLNANEFLKGGGNAPLFQGKCNGTSATASCSGTALYLERQS